MAIPIWVKQAIDVWMAAGSVQKGRLLRSVIKGVKIKGEALTDCR